jgi:death on curing protein
MLSKNVVLLIHQNVLLAHGGANGTRDENALDGAIGRPFQTFGGEDLYPTPLQKAAAIGESIIMNHPFVDGNKRTGYVLMETLLRGKQLNNNRKRRRHLYLCNRYFYRHFTI